MAKNKQGINIAVVIALVVAILLAANMFNRTDHPSEQNSGHHELQEQALLNNQPEQGSNTQKLDVQDLNAHDSNVQNQKTVQANSRNSTQHSSQDDTDKIQQAFTAQRNDVQVQASGRVRNILPDDNKGSRHQRFVLELGTGQTILIAHNIDLAPRVANIQKGDRVEFYGVYEYNPQGGVVHWTHHDPQGQHIGGWLKHQGQTYQ